jgi:GTP cyclohydrolase II
MFPFEDILAQAADHRQRTGRPLVTLTYAQSLDGSLTSRRGQSLVLSGPQSMKITHQLRAAHDAILVGIGTVLADDPRLSVRLSSGDSPGDSTNDSPNDHPQPVILDSFLRTPIDARLVSEPVRPLWIATTAAAPQDRRQALAAKGVRLIDLPIGPESGISLTSLLSQLAESGINSLMVEGGARVIASFLHQRLANQVLVTIAPCFVGGLSALETPIMGEFPRLAGMQAQMLGEDLIVWGPLASHL